MSGIEDLINQFNEMNIIKRIIVGCCAVYLILMIITLLGHAILGIPWDSYTEETPTDYTDFVDLDLDGNGGLSFDEVKYYDHNSEFTISDSDLYSYVFSVKSHLEDLKAQKEKAQREAQERAKKSSSSSSSSSSSHSHSSSYDSYDGAETCPYCGSEAVYSSGNGYRCAECGNYISNPDDLNLNYEEGYYELTLPSFINSINKV